MKKIYFLVVALCLFTSVNAQIINIPNANFKTKLLAASTSNTIAKDLSGLYFKIDSNSNGQIEQNEALNVKELDVSLSSITDIIGIEFFVNLTSLNVENNQIISLNLNSNTRLITLRCGSNRLTSLNVNNILGLKSISSYTNQLTSLDISNCTALEILGCGGNQITSLNINNNTALLDLTCGSNRLTNLDVSNNNGLKRISCYSNLLTSLNVSNCTGLEFLSCESNQLVTINLNNNSFLKELTIGNNLLTSLDLSYNTALTKLTCQNNRLTSLDLSNNGPFSGSIWVHDNQLESLFLKNGNNNTVAFSNNPNLKYICADESELINIQSSITSLGYTNCHVNSYCSFTLGGEFYTIQGNNKYDENNNGCDVLDLGLPNLRFNITNGTIIGAIISNATANYSIPVQAGLHTVTPVFENPTYFSVSPTNVVVNFPTQASPFTQNFCVTANGVHPDLEVTILPIIGARPGFDATYKIIYKNKGNTTQSGTVNLAFNDAVLDLISANPTTTTQTTNNLSWAFTNLLPFETREILVTLNVNSPMETPAVNGGDVLNYTATITSPAIDDLPNDNTFAYNQTVVNSFDPNDKTCLDGATITQAKVGDYVHYMIRFENNGTANAENIVVKDMIDLAKFDINSIVPIKGSHSFVTNITAGNKVEFIFENINLPFDDANNDGYVSFKIKTKSTLVLGDTFTNNASIYFDYNFPIVTNTATTTVAALSVQDFVFSNYFSVYPNPVSNVLNITSKESIEVSSINIYNTLGQLVLVILNAQNTKTVDVSSLTTGNYFIKINSDKGTSNTKFVKN